MSKQRKLNCIFSGTTCNLTFQFNKYLISASVGDSRSILIEDTKGSPNFDIIELSIDHKPDLEQEYERIIKNGGVVEQITDDFGEKFGPKRVWKKGQLYPGLAMSRSLGDFQAKKCGVISTPHIVEYKINPKTKYLVICSDGIWEFTDNNQVREIGNLFYNKNDLKGFCTELVNKAFLLWEDNDIIRDDITVVCVYF